MGLCWVIILIVAITFVTMSYISVFHDVKSNFCITMAVKSRNDQYQSSLGAAASPPALTPVPGPTSISSSSSFSSGTTPSTQPRTS